MNIPAGTEFSPNSPWNFPDASPDACEQCELECEVGSSDEIEEDIGEIGKRSLCEFHWPICIECGQPASVDELCPKHLEAA